MSELPFRIAEAFEHVAKVNHYLVTVDLSRATWDDVCEAQQILIRKENENPEDKALNFALDLCEQAEEKKRRES